MSKNSKTISASSRIHLVRECLTSYSPRMSSWMFLWNLFTFVYQTTGIGSLLLRAVTGRNPMADSRMIWLIHENKCVYMHTVYIYTHIYTRIYIYTNIIIYHIYKSMKSIHSYIYIHNIPVISHPPIQPSTLPAPVTAERVWIGDNV